jgi:antitoxin component of RelBE/YafQ-DinJ toxin-antitoxin module
MKKVLILIAIAIVSFSIAANAQNASANANQNVSLTLSNAIAITFTGSGTNTGAAVTLPFSTVSDYANGVTSAAQQLRVQSNLPFSVTVKSNAANFSYTGSYTTGTTMPVSGVLKLMVSANATGGTIASPFSSVSYATLSSADQNLINNGTYGANQLFSVQYQATPGFTYPAGTYTTQVVYTATQQ